jgi:chemotaxis methyl-accepting protein methylase
MTTNLVESEGFRPSHDVVMCHNVLIYFSPGAVTRAVSYLASCVALGGYLMLGPGEAPSDRPAGLEPVIVNGVRAFQRRSARPLESRP